MDDYEFYEAKISSSIKEEQKTYSNGVKRLVGTQRLLRWPILILIFLIFFINFIAYLLVRLIITVYELFTYCFFCAKIHKDRIKRLGSAMSFEEWAEAAKSLDRLEHRKLYLVIHINTPQGDSWKNSDESYYYDSKLIKETIEKLTEFREANKANELIDLLKNIYCSKILSGLDREELYCGSYYGTKNIISRFIKEVIVSTKLVIKSETVSLEKKAEFIQFAKNSYGGSINAMFHFGVLKTLIEHRALPTVISGASAGALMAAIICLKTDDELIDYIQPELALQFQLERAPFYTELAHLLCRGHILDPEDLKKMIRDYLGGDVTFIEAFRRTKRVLNISTTSNFKHSQPVVLNYINAPNVCIWSAILASSALPFILPPLPLYEKDEDESVHLSKLRGKNFSDASIKIDIPIDQIKQQFKVNYCIVSQTNPHIAPFYFSPIGYPNSPPFRGLKHGLFRGGFLLSGLELWLRLELAKWLKLLGDLDLMPEPLGHDLRFVFLQHFTGDVTIVPPMSISDIFFLFSSPSIDRMKSYILRGQRGTWKCLSKIVSHYIFERTLNESAAVLGLSYD